MPSKLNAIIFSGELIIAATDLLLSFILFLALLQTIHNKLNQEIRFILVFAYSFGAFAVLYLKLALLQQPLCPCCGWGPQGAQCVCTKNISGTVHETEILFCSQTPPSIQLPKGENSIPMTNTYERRLLTLYPTSPPFHLFVQLNIFSYTLSLIRWYDYRPTQCRLCCLYRKDGFVTMHNELGVN